MHKCIYCHLTFRKQCMLKTHLLVHTAVKQFSCSKCFKRFKQKGTLDIHMRSVHLKIKRHKCAVCKSSFSSLNQLRLHSGTHERHKKYKCTLCPATFVQKGTFLKHINSVKHAGKRISNKEKN